MPLDINKPGDDLNKSAKLSKFGLAVIIGVVCLILGVVAFFLLSGAAEKERQQKEQPVVLAIQRAMTVCESSLTAVSATQSVFDEFNAINQEIAQTKDVQQKVDLANNAISFVLNQVLDQQGLVDELNGSRNRIFVAFNNYKQE